jgi:hypothetical protein
LRRARSVLVVLAGVLPATACHRFETVNDLSAVAGVRGRVTLSPEGRANNARRLGGVATEILGLLAPIGTDSISIKADEVRFADLGTVPYAQGELRFANGDVEGVSREVIDRRKSTIITALALVGVAIVGTVFSPGDGFFGIGRTAKPTPR